MIKDYIKDLHSKPESHRKKVAYGTSAGITLVIALIWVTSFGYFNKLNPDTQTATVAVAPKVQRENENKNYLSSAFQALKSAVGAKSNSNATTTGTLEYVPE